MGYGPQVGNKPLLCAAYLDDDTVMKNHVLIMF